MPGKSEIQWTDATWNPVTGCTKVSAGCDHCYAETFAERWRGIPGHPYEQGFDLRLWPTRLDIPIRWTKPRKIFVNSMSDLFHADVPDDFIDKVWAAMLLSPHHIFQVLTKRPRRMQRYVSDPSLYDRVLKAAREFRSDRPKLGDIPISDPTKHPADHIWLGTSVENQDAAYRIDYLVRTPAAVRFLSCEPLLGPLDLDKWLWNDDPCTPGLDDGCPDSPTYALDWIITGGESGHGFRPLNLNWVRSIRDQCLDAHVAYFHKQNGGHTPKANGRLLDGRTWDEMPDLTKRGRQPRLMEVV